MWKQSAVNSDAMRLLALSEDVVRTRYQPSVAQVEAMFLAKMHANDSLHTCARKGDIGGTVDSTGYVRPAFILI